MPNAITESNKKGRSISFWSPQYLLKSGLRALVVGVLGAVIFCPTCFVNPDQDNLDVLTYYVLTAFILWEVARIINSYLASRYNWQSETRKLLWLNALFILLIFVPLNSLYIYIRFQVVSERPELFDPTHMYVLFRNNLVTYILFTSLLNARSFFQAWKKSIYLNKDLERQRVDYQLMALKNQINPHFLFNNLNVLSQVVRTDPRLAEVFIDRLSKVYRYLLQQQDKDIVPIEEELDFLSSFLFLIELRFSGQTEISIEKEGLSDFLIAPVVLQMLIENAFKHNEVSKEYPLRISIERDTDYVVVSNSVRPCRGVAYSTGMGLQNIKKRYSLLSDREISIMEDYERFEVRIPIILGIASERIAS